MLTRLARESSSKPFKTSKPIRCICCLLMSKLSELIEKNHVSAELIAKPSTEQTLKAHEALLSLGHQVEASQMIKALVCVPVIEGRFTEEKAVLALLAGPDKLDLNALSKTVGCERIIIADQSTAERLSGYPRGGTPPVFHDHPMPLVVDDALYSKPVLYGGGGSTETVLKITPAEIKRVTEEIEKAKFLVARIRA